MSDKKIYKLLVFSLLLYANSTISLRAEPSSAPVPGQTVADDKKRFDQALLLSSQKQWEQAEGIYRDLIKRQPLWPEARNNLAVALLKAGQLDEARAFLESAVISSPSYRIAQHNRSMLYAYLAAQAYNEVLDVESPLKLPELELIQKIELAPTDTVEKGDEQESLAMQLREHSMQVNQQLEGWSRAWSEGDFELYVQFYSTRFVPSDSQQTLAEWKENRKARLNYAQGVKIDIDQLRVFFEFAAESGTAGEYALVEFIQYYQSATYKDKVLKQVYMHRQQNNWRIVSERTIKTF